MESINPAGASCGALPPRYHRSTTAGLAERRRWVPARPTSPIEHGVHDQQSRMLRGFLAGMVEHLAPGGEGWLVLSDLAEHLGLRSRAELLAAIDAAGLAVLGRTERAPTHPRVCDSDRDGEFRLTSS
ncbi:MAG: hypothetical protein ACRDQ5_11100 [Sciscionella sp.]